MDFLWSFLCEFLYLAQFWVCGKWILGWRERKGVVKVGVVFFITLLLEKFMEANISPWIHLLAAWSAIAILFIFLFNEKIKKLLVGGFLMLLAFSLLFRLSQTMLGLFFRFSTSLEVRKMVDPVALVWNIVILLLLGFCQRREARGHVRGCISWKGIAGFTALLLFDNITAFFMERYTYRIWDGVLLLVEAGFFLQLFLFAHLVWSKGVLKEKEALAQQYLKEQQSHYDYLEERERDTRRFRHDLRDHMQMLRVLYERKDDAEFQKYMDRLDTQIQGFGNQIRVQNGIADAIFNKYYAEAKQEGILFQVEGRFPTDCRIEPYDLCVILSNLLRNAIEAAKEPAEKRIVVGIRYLGDEILIRIENTYRSMPKSARGRFRTTKPDDFLHGFGIENVEECVHQNGGHISFEVTEDSFLVLLSVRN